MTNPNPTHDNNDWFPLEIAEHEAQSTAITTLLNQRHSNHARILDLGAGNGRIARPIANANPNHHITALDNDPAAIEALRAARIPNITPLQADFLNDKIHATSPYHAILCLGNTFMTIHDVNRAADLLQRLHTIAEPNAILIIDAIATPFWREVAEGYWASGVAEDGSTQFVWAEGDPVFALRPRHRMDPDAWHPKDDEPKCRLWTLGSLTLLARLTNWSPPHERPEQHITTFIRTENTNPPPL